jgi:hypothetical protein
MRLANAVCRFVELAREVEPAPEPRRASSFVEILTLDL